MGSALRRARKKIELQGRLVTKSEDEIVNLSGERIMFGFSKQRMASSWTGHNALVGQNQIKWHVGSMDIGTMPSEVTRVHA